MYDPIRIDELLNKTLKIMLSMKKIFDVLLLGLFLFSVSVAMTIPAQADSRVVSSSTLPAVATTFLKTHFPMASIVSVYVSEDSDSLVYTVRLGDHTKLEFNARGEWREVDMQGRPIPIAIIPASIRKYLQVNHPGVSVIKIEKQSKYCFEVDLVGDIELTFDSSGRLMEFLD